MPNVCRSLAELRPNSLTLPSRTEPNMRLNSARTSASAELWPISNGDDADDDGVDAKQRCLPELHDVPYDTPPPSNSASSSSSSAAAAAAAASSSGAASSVRRTSPHELMDEPIYANAAAHPPITGSVCLLLSFSDNDDDWWSTGVFEHSMLVARSRQRSLGRIKAKAYARHPQS